MKQAAKQSYRLYAGFLLGLFFDPEDVSNMFLQNIGLLSADYMLLHYRSQEHFITTAVRTNNPT
jgi:hypothetical protein